MTRFYEQIKKVVADEKLKEIQCNKCGKQYDAEQDLNGWGADKFQNLSFSFGYGSPYDCSILNFDLCEECLFTFIESFKVKAIHIEQ